MLSFNFHSVNEVQFTVGVLKSLKGGLMSCVLHKHLCGKKLQIANKWITLRLAYTVWAVVYTSCKMILLIFVYLLRQNASVIVETKLHHSYDLSLSPFLFMPSVI